MDVFDITAEPTYYQVEYKWISINFKVSKVVSEDELDLLRKFEQERRIIIKQIYKIKIDK